MADVSITDLIADLRWRDSLTPQKRVFGIAADALEAAERDAQQAEAAQMFIQKYTGHIGSYLSEYGTTVEVEEFERELEALTEGEKR